jgi:hypothetical protein
VLKLVDAALAPGRDYWAGVYNSTVKGMYEGNVKPYVDTVYERNFRPQVDGLSKRVSSAVIPVITAATSKSRSAVDSSHQFLSNGFHAACLKVLVQLKRISSPPDLIETVDKSCQNPERGVQSVFEFLAVVLIVLFGKFIVRMVTSIIFWVVLLVPRTVVSILSAPPLELPVQQENGKK